MSAPSAAVSEASSWLQPVRVPDPDADALVFFPPAGASASAGWALEPLVPPGWSLWSVQYPGRGARLGEPFAGSIREMASACLHAVPEGAGRLVLFGHSFGAYVAYDAAHLLEVHQRRLAGLVVAGIAAPGTSVGTGDPDRMTDAELMASLGRQGATSPELLADPEVMAMVLPALRADLRLARDYVDDYGRRLAAGLVVLCGSDDGLLTPDQLRSWRRVGRSWRGIEQGVGDHFFYLQDEGLLGAVLDRHWPRPGEA
jgi:surfactin synthase thioesterase subunit